MSDFGQWPPPGGRRQGGEAEGSRTDDPPGSSSGAEAEAVGGAGPDNGRQEPGKARQDPAGVRVSGGYVGVVGFVFVLVAALAIFNALRTEESGTVGIGDVGIGQKVGHFAVPEATSDLEGDANVDPGKACSVEGDDVIRICDYFDRPLVISFWFTRGASRCVDQQDVFERVARKWGDRAGMLSINVRDDRQKVRDLIAERGWTVDVGHDRDGAVSNLYRVGGCPTFLFVRPGGVLDRAEIGTTTEKELGAQVRSFLNGGE